MAIDPSIALQVQQFQAPDMMNALAKAQSIKSQQMQNRMNEREMQSMDAEAQSNQQLNALFRESGGDLSKMRQNPNLDMQTALRLDELQASQGKTQADQKRAQLDLATKQIEAGIMILGSSQDQGSYDAGLQKMQQMGMDVSRFPKQYSPQTVEQLVQQGMTAKDRLQMQRDERRNALEERKLGLMEQRMMQGGQSSGVDAQDKGWEVKETANGLVRVNKYTGDVAPVTMEWQTLKGKQSGSAKTNLSATAQKELFEADDMITSGQNVMSALDQALSLNNKAYSGYGAQERAAVRSNLPGESEEANATVDMNNIITGQALESLKATFGGMPTEGERKILLELQASVDKTPKQRESILKRAREMAARRVEVNRKKADALRKGTYMTESFDAGVGMQDQAPAEDNIDDLLEMYQ